MYECWKCGLTFPTQEARNEHYRQTEGIPYPVGPRRLTRA